MNVQNLQTIVDVLHRKLQNKFQKDQHTAIEQIWQIEGKVDKVSEEMRNLTDQLNKFKPVSKGSLEGANNIL